MAIVGNSGCELGKRKGSAIDDHNIVVRMNDFSIAPPYQADYGKRVTVWCCTFWSDMNFDKFKGMKFEHVVCTLPLHSPKWRDHFGSVQWKVLRSFGTEIVPTRYYEEAEAWVKNPPSSGLVFLYWAYRMRGSLKRDSVFGFSHFDRAIKHHYSDDKGKAGNHNNHGERDMLKAMIAGTV